MLQQLFNTYFKKSQQLVTVRHSQNSLFHYMKNHILNSLLLILSLMGKFQSESFILITYFSTIDPLTSCFLSCRPFVVNATFSTGLVVSSVSWHGKLIVGVQITDYFNCWVQKFILLLGLAC